MFTIKISRLCAKRTKILTKEIYQKKKRINSEAGTKNLHVENIHGCHR